LGRRQLVVGDGIQQIMKQPLDRHVAPCGLDAKLRDEPVLDFEQQRGRGSHMRCAGCRHAARIDTRRASAVKAGLSSSRQPIRSASARVKNRPDGVT
jgi:hypothetical protein